MSKKSLPTLTRWLPVILWAALITFLSSRSDPYGLIPERIYLWIYHTHYQGIRLTKIIGPIGHMVQFGILAFFLARALVGEANLARKHLIQAFSISLLFAIFDEIHQYFVPNRACQLTDVLLDGLGAIFGLMAYVLFFSLRYYLNHREQSLP